MLSTVYAPQRVNYKPTMPEGLKAEVDPRKALLAALKKMGDKQTTRLLNQDPAAVMGAVTNPGDVAPGMKGSILGGIETRARMMGGRS